MSWTNRISGKYKAVFDSPEAHGGAALFRAVAWREQYKEVYGAEPAETTAVVVVRHFGFYLAMNDEFWARYDIGKVLKETDDKGKKWAKTNPARRLRSRNERAECEVHDAGFSGGGRNRAGMRLVIRRRCVLHREGRKARPRGGARAREGDVDPRRYPPAEWDLCCASGAGSRLFVRDGKLTRP